MFLCLVQVLWGPPLSLPPYAMLSHFSRVRLCDPIDGSPPGSPVPGILQARTLEWVAISFSSAWKWKVKVKSLSRVRLFSTPWAAAYQALHPWDFPGKSTGVGCHCLLCTPTLAESIQNTKFKCARSVQLFFPSRFLGKGLEGGWHENKASYEIWDCFQYSVNSWGTGSLEKENQAWFFWQKRSHFWPKPFCGVSWPQCLPWMDLSN